MTPKKMAGAAALACMLMAGVAGAQTTTSTSTATTSPGTPNTGSGGDMTVNAIILATSGVLAIAGVTLLARRVQER